MHSTTVSRKGGKDCAYWLTSQDLQRLGFCLTLNLSERPRLENPSLLSEILEPDADPKYMLSPKACLGILNRAERRGKELPPELKEALEIQAGIRKPPSDRESETDGEDDRASNPSACKGTELTVPTPQDVTAQDGGGGVLHP